MKNPQARFVNSSMFFLKEEKSYANSEGALVAQTIFRSQPSMTVTAVASGDFQSRQSNDIAPRGRGYEHVTEANLIENAPRWAEEAVAKLGARPVDAGRYDLILHPSHLWLTIHESVAHPTELDRAMGYEANYAGTSFATPRSAGTMSKNSVTTAFSLIGTPFWRRYWALRFVVTIFRPPARAAGAALPLRDGKATVDVALHC